VGAGRRWNDPLGSFLRVNEALDRQQGKTVPGGGTPMTATRTPQDPNTPIPVVDDDNQPVLNPSAGL
jgi:hypothetical protein